MGSIVKTLVSPLAMMLFKKPKAPEPPPVQPTLRERPNSSAADALASRRGSQENRRTGRGGAEATGGAKSKLGQ